LLVKRGKVEAGMQLVRALKILHKARHELLTTPLNITLTEGLAITERFGQALALANDTIAQVERGGDRINMPELLRIKGGILGSAPQPDMAQAEACFQRSLELARRQSALAWSCERQRAWPFCALGQDRFNEARETLAPVYARFTEGFQTSDMKGARELLDALSLSA